MDIIAGTAKRIGRAGWMAMPLYILLAACDQPAAPGYGPLPDAPVELRTLGLGEVTARRTSEVWVVGNRAYTGTFRFRNEREVQPTGDAVFIWDVAGDVPRLVDSLIVPGAVALGDLQATPDGRYLVVSKEPEPGAIYIYDLRATPRPRLVGTFSNAETYGGVHTAEVQNVNGRPHAFLSVDPTATMRGRLVIVDLGDPAAPRQVAVLPMGAHDAFVRDGVLFAAAIDDGVLYIYDIGGGGAGGSLAAPALLSTLPFQGGQVHNVWWYADPVQKQKRYAFVGREPGDIHVVDVSDLARPRQVAVYAIPDVSTHNFDMDERRGILYAAYYQAGVRALNVRGALDQCDATQRSATYPDLCDLGRMGREVGYGLTRAGRPVSVWGVNLEGDYLYASDILNGLWKLRAVP